MGHILNIEVKSEINGREDSNLCVVGLERNNF